MKSNLTTTTAPRLADDMEQNLTDMKGFKPKIGSGGPIYTSASESSAESRSGESRMSLAFILSGGVGMLGLMALL